jgi:hypothetical protein
LLTKELETEFRGKSVVTFLVINRIKELPERAIRAVLDTCKDQIVIGYINSADISHLPRDTRITYLRIPASVPESTKRSDGEYLPFSNQEFFILVAYKWELFRLLFEAGVSRIIYSDLDVIWFRDVGEILDKAYAANPSIKVFIQSATIDPSTPQLCMGLVSMTNSQEVLKMIHECFTEHLARATAGEMIGDDDVITTYFRNLSVQGWIKELPQSTFPVGMLINLVNRSSSFPGLSSPNPAIFHANYVVGLENKILLLRMAESMFHGKNVFLELTFRQSIRLIVKKIRQLRRNILQN